MFEVSVYNLEGQEVGKESLAKEIFGLKAKSELIQQVVVAHLANKRQPIAHTKTKGEVRGGGRKPWQQKGTGRARHGSIRSPLWRGGGVIFGPRNIRNFSLKVNQKVKNKALKMVLSDKAANKKILLFDVLSLKEGKTKLLKKLLTNFKIKSGLLSLAEKQEVVIRAAKNIPKLGLLAADSLNVYDLLRYEHLILDKEGLKKIITKFKI